MAEAILEDIKRWVRVVTIAMLLLLTMVDVGAARGERTRGERNYPELDECGDSQLDFGCRVSQCQPRFGRS